MQTERGQQAMNERAVQQMLHKEVTVALVNNVTPTVQAILVSTLSRLTAIVDEAVTAERRKTATEIASMVRGDIAKCTARETEEVRKALVLFEQRIRHRFGVH